MLDMEVKKGFWTTAMLIVIQLTHISAQNVLEYFKKDGTLSFSPSEVPGTIINIMWRHEDNLVAEWVKDAIDLQYYGNFVNRTTLNLATGQLKITRATEADTGVFSLEINNLAQADRYEAKMVGDVPEPCAWVRPGPEPDLYVLYCDPKQGQEAVLKAAEPVSYQWKMGTADWADFGNKVDINVNHTTTQMETFTCRMKNPVSEKTSEPTNNPFYNLSPSPGQIGAGVAGVGVGVAIIVACVGAYKKKFNCHRTGNAPISPNADETKNKLNSNPEGRNEDL